MSRKWLRDRSADGWYKLAKAEGYRSRASYKLLQLQEKYKLLREGDAVVDLGAAPGGWSQVAAELVGPEGSVVGVDLARIEPLPGAVFLRGDMTRDTTVAETLQHLGGAADVVISDMSPNISGAYETDHARSVHLCQHALRFAEKALRPDGRFACKVFEGDLFPGFRAEVKKRFKRVQITNPKASRKSSSEIYVVGLGFKGPAPYTPDEATSRREKEAARGVLAPGWSEGDTLPPSRRERTQREEEE